MSKGKPQFRMTGAGVRIKRGKYTGPTLTYTGEETEPLTTEDKRVHYEDDDRPGLSLCGTKMVAWGRKKPLKLAVMRNMTLEELCDEWHYCKRCLHKIMINLGIIFR